MWGGRPSSQGGKLKNLRHNRLLALLVFNSHSFCKTTATGLKERDGRALTLAGPAG